MQAIVPFLSEIIKEVLPSPHLSHFSLTKTIDCYPLPVALSEELDPCQLFLGSNSMDVSFPCLFQHFFFSSVSVFCSSFHAPLILFSFGWLFFWQLFYLAIGFDIIFISFVASVFCRFVKDSIR